MLVINRDSQEMARAVLCRYHLGFRVWVQGFVASFEKDKGFFAQVRAFRLSSLLTHWPCLT